VVTPELWVSLGRLLLVSTLPAAPVSRVLALQSLAPLHAVVARQHSLEES